MEEPATSGQPAPVRVIEERWTVLRHGVETIAIVAAGLWAAYVFVYQEQIKPAFEPPSLQLNVTFEPGKTARGVRVAQLHIDLTNTGQVNTDVYADTATVFGDRFVKRAPSPQPSDYTTAVAVNEMVQSGPKALVFGFARLYDGAVGGGKGHIALTPGQHIGLILPIAVEEGRFDELNASVSIAYGRFYERRDHFSRVAIARDKTGAYSLIVPPKKADRDTDIDDETVQTTL